MGLTIHYSLSFPAKTPIATIKAKLAALRQRCLDLPFQNIGEMLDLSGDCCDFEKRAPEDKSSRWLLIQAGKYVNYEFDPASIPRKIDKMEGGEYFCHRVNATRIIGFVVHPGAGCEPANVALRLLPKQIDVPRRDGRGHAALKVGGGWAWSSFCKTQYASNPGGGGSFENFLRCHLSIVTLLDYASEIGFYVEVSDEGGFFEGRDVEALLREVASQNEMVAGFAGIMKDVLGTGKAGIAAPILSNPDFERLEMKGRGRIDQKLAELIEKVARKRATAFHRRARGGI